MKQLLFVNACVRGEDSRTYHLAETFLNALGQERFERTDHDLTAMNLQPLNRDTLAMREKICDGQYWDEPMIQPARVFQKADLVVIAAPYWDLSFPSILKVWVEHMYVRNLTFVYRDDKPIGLCKAQDLVYITTAGSPIGENNWGYGYIQAVARMLGVQNCVFLSAEALDLEHTDTEAILAAAQKEAKQLAERVLLSLIAPNE